MSTAASAFQITVRPCPEYKVRVEFSDEITLARQRSLYDALYDVLSELPGVEQVAMHRYSVSLSFAPHITSQYDLIIAIVASLTDDAWVTDELDEAYPERTVTSY